MALTLLVALFAAPLHADIDESAYEAVGAVRGEAQRQKMQAELAREITAEQQRAAEEAAAMEKIHAESVAREAARPYPERLTEQQCTLCHPAENYTSKHHTWLYWRLVVARMVWLNEAPVTPEAQTTIVAHLAKTYPARGEEIVTEYGLPAIMLALLSGTAWAARRLWKGRS